VLMPTLVQAGLIIGSVVAFILLAFSLRKEQTWPAILLWVAPVALAVPLADLSMAGLARVLPAFAMDGQAGDGWRFGFVFFVVLCAVEISTQLFMTRIAGTSAVYREAGAAATPSSDREQAAAP
jgi:hypothetical protein